MVFSIQSVKESLNKKDMFKENKTSEEDIRNISFFIESFKFILEESDQFNIVIKEDISMGLRPIIKKYNIIGIFNSILDKFVDSAEKLWSKFEELLGRYSNNAEIVRNKSILENYKNSFVFYEDIFIFTNLRVNKSYTSFKNELNKELADLLGDLNKFKKYKTYDEVYKELDIMRKKISDYNSSCFDKMRKQILATDDYIAKYEYSGVLFNYFRNGGVLSKNRIIGQDQIKDYFTFYFDEYKKFIKDIKKDKEDLIHQAKEIRKKFNDINLEDYISQSITPQMENTFMNILNVKSMRVKEICDIYLLFFGAKLDAVVQYRLQSEKILIEACRQIQLREE